MRAVVTRVKNASVVINEQVNGQIGTGFLVLLGVGPNDTEVTADKLADKICNLRVFEDENEKMNLNLEQVGGSLLVVSQFTLYADTSSRPPRLLRCGQARSGHPPLRAVHGPLPGAGLRCAARRIRRRHAGLFPERRSGHHPVRHGRVN